MPPMLGDIVVQLLGTLPDVDFVGRGGDNDDALEAARKTNADLLIIREPDAPLESIFAQPGLSVLQISPNGQNGALVKFDQQHVVLDRASVGRIASLIGSRFAGHA